MVFFINQTISGIVFGMLLFLLAAGLSLILGIMRNCQSRPWQIFKLKYSF
jgi:branched-subunit amino acid ABC-type transport system permease component